MSDVPQSARSGGRLAAWIVFVAALTALNYGSRLASDTTERDLLYQWVTFANALVLFGFMAAVMLAISARGPARDLLALTRPTGWAGASLIAIATLVLTFAVGIAVSPFADPEEEQGLLPEAWDPERAAPFVANFIVISMFVPVVEELAFRGVGFALLAARMPRGAAVLAIGTLFGLAHGLVVGLPILIAFGVGLAWLRSHTRSVYPSMALHGLFNAFNLLISITSGAE